MWETGGENMALPEEPRNDGRMSPGNTWVVHMPLHRPGSPERPQVMPRGPFHG
jgi:hypothetical protein